MTRVKSISEIQRNITAITQECKESGEPIYLTRNGTVSLVVMDAKAFDDEMALHNAVFDREIRVKNSILRGLEDENFGRTRSLKQARKDANQIRKDTHG